MSISGSMSSALSGLTVASRSAEIVSSNIANALTDGYVRRELQVGARRVGDTGQGAQVNGVLRDVNTILLGDRRVAQAASTGMELRLNFLNKTHGAIGSPDDGASLSGRIAALDSALLAAASQPQSEVRLSSLARTASSLTETFNQISQTLQTSRREADTQIAAEVETVNQSLVQISDLNGYIASLSSGGRDTSSLQDQRQQLIDQISTIIPLREVTQKNGRVALYTTGGAALLDGRPVELSFTPVGVITPDMTRASGALSGLSINGNSVRTDAGGVLAGGSLSALFSIRDQEAPAAQSQLDAVARDLVERFANPALDPTLSLGDAGLFTDAGGAFLPADEIGLSSRIRLNIAVDPAQGGEAWRLRDGIGAASQGPVGQSALLTSLQSALSEARPISSTAFSAGSRSLSGLSAELSSSVASQLLFAETETSFSNARTEAFRSLELEAGVDTDRELQDLLLIEQAYGANAKVVQTIDEMIQLLLGM